MCVIVLNILKFKYATRLKLSIYKSLIVKNFNKGNVSVYHHKTFKCHTNLTHIRRLK